jgi:GNAT superfamily N-acetyltransferase
MKSSGTNACEGLNHKDAKNTKKTNNNANGEKNIMSYTYRPINMDTDFKMYYEQYCVELTEKYGSFNMSESEVRAEFADPAFNVATDTQAAFTTDGKMVASAVVFATHDVPVRPRLFGYVLPEYRNQGIATRLIEWGIERAKQVFERVPADARVVLQSWGMLESEKQLLEGMGYELARLSLEMRMEFDEAPPQVEFPQGMDLFTYAEHPQLIDFVRVRQATFRDHRGFVEEPLEKTTAAWQKYIDARPDFIPELMIMLKDGANDVGMVFASPATEEEADRGYIESIGISREYRRRGLGMALLQYTFGELYKRGIHKVALGVDGSSLTGAVELYKKAGMYIAHVHNAYELELRPGIEYSNQGQQTETA